VIETEAQARDWLAERARADGAVMDRLERLVALLREENERQNLVSAASLDRVWQRHIADSAQLLEWIPAGHAMTPWLDLGSGGGFPGLVIAALMPDVEVVMVEARPLRTQWLQRALDSMELRAARVITSKLESVQAFPAAVISARAFAPLDKTLRLSARFSTNDTMWVLPKGRAARDELMQLRGWNHMFHVEQSLTDAESGIIVGTLRNTMRRNP